jgi:hypothetical protein
MHACRDKEVLSQGIPHTLLKCIHFYLGVKGNFGVVTFREALPLTCQRAWPGPFALSTECHVADEGSLVRHMPLRRGIVALHATRAVVK